MHRFQIFCIFLVDIIVLPHNYTVSIKNISKFYTFAARIQQKLDFLNKQLKCTWNFNLNQKIIEQEYWVNNSLKGNLLNSESITV